MNLTVNVSASCLNVGSIIGGLVGGYLGGKVGPRRTLQLACVLGVVSWLLMALAPHLSVLIFGRILSGIAGSGGVSNVALLISQYWSDVTVGTFAKDLCFCLAL